jgi:hypothetical protein
MFLAIRTKVLLQRLACYIAISITYSVIIMFAKGAKHSIFDLSLGTEIGRLDNLGILGILGHFGLCNNSNRLGLCINADHFLSGCGTHIDGVDGV